MIGNRYLQKKEKNEVDMSMAKRNSRTLDPYSISQSGGTGSHPTKRAFSTNNNNDINWPSQQSTFDQRPPGSFLGSNTDDWSVSFQKPPEEPQHLKPLIFEHTNSLHCHSHMPREAYQSSSTVTLARRPNNSKSSLTLAKVRNTRTQ